MGAESSIGCDVVVIGGGNAGFCAAVSAAQSKAGKVILIDKCPKAWAGGNSYFTAGAFRAVHAGLEDVLPLVSNVDEETAKMIELEPYTVIDFLNDMSRITHGKYDKELGRVLVEESNGAVKWLAENGLQFELSFNRQVGSRMVIRFLLSFLGL
jgi:succinate dehydrogenase/fumarate reductase flavoprotein subunit